LDCPRPREPSSAIRTSSRRPLPATSLMLDLLGEPHRFSSCPVPPPLTAGAPPGDLTASHPPVGHRRPRHRASHARSDRASSKRRGAQRARTGYGHLGCGLGQAGQATGLQVLRPWAKCRVLLFIAFPIPRNPFTI
jgi:hypothetical protein